MQASDVDKDDNQQLERGHTDAATENDEPFLTNPEEFDDGTIAGGVIRNVEVAPNGQSSSQYHVNRMVSDPTNMPGQLSLPILDGGFTQQTMSSATPGPIQNPKSRKAQNNGNSTQSTAQMTPSQQMNMGRNMRGSLPGSNMFTNGHQGLMGPGRFPSQDGFNTNTPSQSIGQHQGGAYGMFTGQFNGGVPTGGFLGQGLQQMGVQFPAILPGGFTSQGVCGGDGFGLWYSSIHDHCLLPVLHRHDHTGGVYFNGTDAATCFQSSNMPQQIFLKNQSTGSNNPNFNSSANGLRNGYIAKASHGTANKNLTLNQAYKVQKQSHADTKQTQARQANLAKSISNVDAGVMQRSPAQILTPNNQRAVLNNLDQNSRHDVSINNAVGQKMNPNVLSAHDTQRAQDQVIGSNTAAAATGQTPSPTPNKDSSRPSIETTGEPTFVGLTDTAETPIDFVTAEQTVHEQQLSDDQLQEIALINLLEEEMKRIDSQEQSSQNLNAQQSETEQPTMTTDPQTHEPNDAHLMTAAHYPGQEQQALAAPAQPYIVDGLTLPRDFSIPGIDGLTNGYGDQSDVLVDDMQFGMLTALEDQTPVTGPAFASQATAPEQRSSAPAQQRPSGVAPTDQKTVETSGTAASTATSSFDPSGAPQMMSTDEIDQLFEEMDNDMSINMPPTDCPSPSAVFDNLNQASTGLDLSTPADVTDKPDAAVDDAGNDDDIASLFGSESEISEQDPDDAEHSTQPAKPQLYLPQLTLPREPSPQPQQQQFALPKASVSQQPQESLPKLTLPQNPQPQAPALVPAKKTVPQPNTVLAASAQPNTAKVSNKSNIAKRPAIHKMPPVNLERMSPRDRQNYWMNRFTQKYKGSEESV